MRGPSKLEHCPKCDSTTMKNYVHIEPGKDTQVFVECAECSAFVARYTLKLYTCDKPYDSFLRLMHKKRMGSGGATQKELKAFEEDLFVGFEKVKIEVETAEDPRSIEEILSQT
jgi:hypothetical protein